MRGAIVVGHVGDDEITVVRRGAGPRDYPSRGSQHVQAGVKYPAVLGVAGWNDPRVVPWQPGKLVAAMRHKEFQPTR